MAEAERLVAHPDLSQEAPGEIVEAVSGEGIAGIRSEVFVNSGMTEDWQTVAGDEGDLVETPGRMQEYDSEIPERDQLGEEFPTQEITEERKEDVFTSDETGAKQTEHTPDILTETEAVEYSEGQPQEETPDPHQIGAIRLTKREIQLWILLRGGLKPQQIADIMGVSASTLADHRTHLYRKLSVVNRKEARSLFTEYGEKGLQIEIGKTSTPQNKVGKVARLEELIPGEEVAMTREYGDAENSQKIARKRPENEEKLPGLAPAQKATLIALAQGKNIVETGEILGIDANEVLSHLNSTYQMLRVSNRIRAVVAALETRRISFEDVFCNSWPMHRVNVSQVNRVEYSLLQMVSSGMTLPEICHNTSMTMVEVEELVQGVNLKLHTTNQYQQAMIFETAQKDPQFQLLEAGYYDLENDTPLTESDLTALETVQQQVSEKPSRQNRYLEQEEAKDYAPEIITTYETEIRALRRKQEAQEETSLQTYSIEREVGKADEISEVYTVVTVQGANGQRFERVFALRTDGVFRYIIHCRAISSSSGAGTISTDHARIVYDRDVFGQTRIENSTVPLLLIQYESPTFWKARPMPDDDERWNPERGISFKPLSATTRERTVKTPVTNNTLVLEKIVESLAALTGKSVESIREAIEKKDHAGQGIYGVILEEVFSDLSIDFEDKKHSEKTISIPGSNRTNPITEKFWRLLHLQVPNI